jgi:hypothetical protein
VDAEWQYRRSDSGGGKFTLRPTKVRGVSGLELIRGTYAKNPFGAVEYSSPDPVVTRMAEAAVERFLIQAGVPADMGANAMWEVVRGLPGRPSKRVAEEAQIARRGRGMGAG